MGRRPAAAELTNGAFPHARRQFSPGNPHSRHAIEVPWSGRWDETVDDATAVRRPGGHAVPGRQRPFYNGRRHIDGRERRRCRQSTPSRGGTPVTQFFCALRHASVHLPLAGNTPREPRRASAPSDRAARQRLAEERLALLLLRGDVGGAAEAASERPAGAARRGPWALRFQVAALRE
jgi:hypothetical protein